MPTQDEIDHQQQLLTIYRRNLAHQFRRAEHFGGQSAAPPDVVNGIYEARSSIGQIKGWLRQHGVQVEDQVNEDLDTKTSSGGSTDVAAPRPILKVTRWAVITLVLLVIVFLVLITIATNVLP